MQKNTTDPMQVWTTINIKACKHLSTKTITERRMLATQTEDKGYIFLFVQVSLWAENPHCKREELGLPVSPTLRTVISLALIVTTGWVIAGAGRIIAGTGRVVSRASTGAHTTANTTEGVSRVVTHTHTFTATLLSLKAGWKNPF